MIDKRLDPQRGSVRGVRAAVLALPTVGLAAAAHGAAFGCVSLVGFLFALGLAWPAAVAVLRRQGNAALLACWGAAVQLSTHVVLDALCRDASSWNGSRTHLASPMLAAHVVSAVVVAALLARADAGLWTARAIVRLVARWGRLITPEPLLPTTELALRATPPTWWAVESHAARRFRRRGPPVASALR